MSSDVNFCELVIIDSEVSDIFLLVKPCPNFQAGLGFRRANIFEHDLQGAKWFISPIGTNMTKQAMVNRIPF